MLPCGADDASCSNTRPLTDFYQSDIEQLISNKELHLNISEAVFVRRTLSSNSTVQPIKTDINNTEKYNEKTDI